MSDRLNDLLMMSGYVALAAVIWHSARLVINKLFGEKNNVE